MQTNTKYQNLIKGQPQSITLSELGQFQNYCLQQSILPEYLIKITINLYRQNKEHAYHFLQFIADNCLQQKYQDPFYNQHKICLYNYLTILVLGKAARTIQVEIAQYWLLVAKKYLTQAQAIQELLDYQTILNRAIIYFYQGEIAKAITFAQKCQEVVNNQPTKRKLITSTFVILAQCYFAKRNYEKSLEYYKKCLLLNKCLSIKTRLGMAYCYFNLNRFQMAKACFQRILKLNANCSAALVGLGIVYERNQSYNFYFNYLQMAYSINNKEPLTFYLIAQHYLVRNQLEKCSFFCKRGLKKMKSFSRLIKRSQSFRNDYNELYRRFINIQGQIQHKKNNFLAAIEYYKLPVQKQLLWNDISLIQCLIYTQNYEQALQRIEYTYRVYQRQKKDSRYLKDSYRLMAFLKRKCKQVKDQQKNSIYYYNEAIKYDKNDVDLKCELSYLLTTTDPHKAHRIMEQVQKILQINNTEVSPQMLINIGVLAILNHEPQLGEIKLKKAIEVINRWDDLNQIQQKGFLLIAKYNYGVCLQNLNLKYQALQLYNSIINENKFHHESYLRKAYLLHKIGNYQESLLTLSQAEKVCKKQPYKQHLLQSVHALKVYLLYLQGKCEQSLQMLVPIIQKKQQNVYYKVLELAIRYKSIINIQNNHQKLLQLLLQGRDYCIQICKKDSNSLFCFMMLITFLASIKQLPKQFGITAFKNISVNANQLPSIRYNTGLYYMGQDDYQAAISCFNQLKDYSQFNKASELISYLFLMYKDYKKSIKQIKKNILLDPSNLMYRAQLVYATQARCQEDFNNTNKKNWMIASQEIKKCMKFHNSFKQDQFFKNYQNSSKTKQQILLKLRAISQQKIISVSALIDKFEKKKIQFNPKGHKLVNSDSEQSEDQQGKIDRQNQRKRQVALAKVKAEKDKFNQAWELMNEKKNKAMEAQKLKRKPHKSKELQDLSAPTKKQMLKQKNEEIDQKQTEDYYVANKQKQGLVKKQVIKEEKGQENESLKKYLA